MKKIVFVLWSFLLSISPTYAQLDVKANIAWGTYDSVLEVYLIANQKDAKIFYTTSPTGQVNELKQFQNTPILIKENTSLNFFAWAPEYESTKIQEENYTIRYPQNISVQYQDGKIILKNNSSESINIMYWSIEAGDFSHTFEKNSYIAPLGNITIPYHEKKSQQTFQLFSPDKHLVSTSIYTEKKQVSGEKKSIDPPLSSQTSPLSQTGTQASLPSNNTPETNYWEPFSPERWVDELKASANDIKMNKEDQIFYFILWFFWLMLLIMNSHQIYQTIKNEPQWAVMKKKSKKF